MLQKSIAIYEEAVDYILNIPKFTTKHTLEETRDFLHVLGDPDRKLHIIHVAGTNGKGSVCTYMRSILEAAGKRVAVFTSPHLVDIRERFYLEGEMPGKEEFLQAFLQVYDRLDWEKLKQGEGYHPTFFEYLFFMAMLLFAERMPDYCILETGMGGRLDATNSVSEKELTVITRIGLDHVEYLGHTIEEIAGEKAGIMRAGTPLVFTDEVPKASKVLKTCAKELPRTCAKELQVSTYPVSKKDYRILKITNKTIDFLGNCRYHSSIGFTIPTIALYQVENAMLAIRAVEVLMQQKGEELSEETLQRGVEGFYWAGRMEEVLPQVYVDGGHNADGIKAFLDSVAKDGCDGKRRLLFGVVADKDYVQMLEQLVRSGLFNSISIAHLRNGRAASLNELKAVMGRYPSYECKFYEDVNTAFCELLDGQQDERIYVVGSLYLVGEIKELIGRISQGALE